MSTGRIILISTLTSAAVFLLLFFCFDRFADRGGAGSRVIAEERFQQESAYKMLGRMGEAMTDYAGFALGASNKSDEEIACEFMGKNFDFVGDVLRITGGDNPIVNATADFYDAAGELFSEPDKVENTARNFGKSVNKAVEDAGESINNFFENLF